MSKRQRSNASGALKTSGACGRVRSKNSVFNIKTEFLKYVTFLLVLFFSISSNVQIASAAASSGIEITNQVQATYDSLNGKSFVAHSNKVKVVVATVSSLTLGPTTACSESTDSVIAGSSVTKTFTITNTSNGDDAYQLTSLNASAGTITSAYFGMPNTSQAQIATVGGSVSQTVLAGKTLPLTVTVSTLNVGIGTHITVLASVKTTANSANGSVSQSASQCIITMTVPVISGPGGPNTKIEKTVNSVSFIQSSNGNIVTYDVRFKNTGGSTAHNVVLDDPVPDGVTPNLSSVLVNGVDFSSKSSMTANDLKISVGDVFAGQSIDVRFKAMVTEKVLGLTLVNTASLTAPDIQQQFSKPASIFYGIGNVVFDGAVGLSAPVGGAVVTILPQGSLTPITLDGTVDINNIDQKNPFITKANGLYGFGFMPKKMTTYTVTVTASGYLPRQLELTIVPDATGTLYTVTLKSLDGQPLAIPGGFALEPGPVSLSSVYGFFGNIPLFRPSSVSLTKTVDRSTASGGDRLVYSLDVAPVSTSLGMTTVTDDLPPYVVFASGTGRVDGIPVQPTVMGSRLTWVFPTLDGRHRIVFATVIVPNVSDSIVLTNTAVARAAMSNAPGFFTTARSQAQTAIIPGIFSDRTPIVGRVYADVRDSDRFLRGDVGLSGVRVWLENGESVTTDSFGRFNFPSTRPGMHVLHVDETTLPNTVIPYLTHAYNEERSLIRLIHGPFDGGLLQDINFSLKPVLRSVK